MPTEHAAPKTHSLLLPPTPKFSGVSSGSELVELGRIMVSWHGLELLQGSWSQSIPLDAVTNFNSEPDMRGHTPRWTINKITLLGLIQLIL